MGKETLICAVIYACIFTYSSGAPQKITDGKTSESFNVTLVMYSGRPDPNWILNGKLQLHKQIISDIKKHYGHDHSHANPNVKAAELPSDGVYKGLVIDHIENGVSLHKWVLRRCDFPVLEWKLVRYTAGKDASGKDRISNGGLVVIGNTLVECKNKKRQQTTKPVKEEKIAKKGEGHAH